jgi:ATP/maltotriose-dependent transcriptional regulator MalT
VTLADEALSAHAEQDWQRAYDLLGTRDDLGAAELSALADAAWWLGKLDESAAARERAFQSRYDASDLDAAALEAFFLSLALGDKGDDALASGWRSRSYRIAEQLVDPLASGYLLSMEAIAAYHRGDAEGSVEKARATAEIGRRHGDETLVAWAIHVEGLGLVKMGDVDKGWARLDESMVSAVAGRLKPMWAGLMHCGMLVACEEWGDPRRAWQWVEATEKWLDSVPGAVMYPGVCRVHKVRVMQLRGTWNDAETEAREACAQLLDVHAYTAARAYYEIAEIKRLTGDYNAAYALYKQAHHLGWDPQPGLALLRLSQGRVDAAVAA